MDEVQFAMENRERIQAVESSFGPSGKSLLEPGRVLVGEGRLMKLSRRRPQPKAFFLFNDILVYGSIVVSGRWNKRQQIIRLEEVQQEDLEDSMEMPNQWLLKTPRKSFYIAAASAEEKQAWMEHINNCRAQQLQRLGANMSTNKVFAATWIPDSVSAICMRCSSRFNVTHRRHHCRRCGFIVCNSCSKSRAMLRHISSKPVRVCLLCKDNLDSQAQAKHQSWNQTTGKDDWKKSSMEDTPEYEVSSEEELEEQVENKAPTQWWTPDNYSEYCYFKAEHLKPPLV